MRLNQKHLKIVEMLMPESIVADKLSHLVNISQRTLSNYIAQINDYFKGTSQVLKEYQIFFLLIDDEEGFLARLTSLRQALKSDEEELTDRMDAIFHHLLKHKQSTIDNISDELFLSKSVVNHLLMVLKCQLQSYRIDIKGVQNVGLYLEGNEFTIRKVLIEQLPMRYQDIYVPLQIEQYLKELKKKFNIDESSFYRVRLATQVTLSRIEEGYLIVEELDIDNQVFESNDFKSFKPLKEYITQFYSVKNTNQEIFLIVFQLLGRRASIIDDMINDREQSMLKRIIKKTIKDINEYYTLKIDEAMFSKDIQLHIKYLINRLIFDVKVNNSLVEGVQQRFPFAYELSKVLAENIKKEINMAIPINELGFLSLYFSVYLEQLEQQIKEIESVAIVTNGGLSTSKLLKNNLRKIFGRHIKAIIFNEEALESENIKEFDLIISTIWTSRLFNKIIYIENILDTQLMKLKIEQFLVYKDVRNKKLFNQSVIVDFIEEKDFYPIKQSFNYQDVILFLAKELVREEKVDSKFMKRIIARERTKSTVTGKLGFPHVSHNQQGIFIKIALMDTPLRDYPEVKIVVLLATPDQTGNEAALIRLYEEVLAISTNSYMLEKMTEDMDYASFAHVLNQEMRE